MKDSIKNLKSLNLNMPAFVAFLFAIVMAASSCNNSTAPAPEDTKKVAEEHNDAKFDNAKKEDDAKFLVAAAEINLEEIELGKLAQKQGMMADVKDLGKMMETAHASALKDLQALAAKKQISIPTTVTDNGKDAYKKLMEKPAKDFDKEYCDMMVNGHKDAISKFEKESTDATDADIKAWATSMLPGLRTHLDHALTCQKKCEKMKM